MGFHMRRSPEQFPLLALASVLLLSLAACGAETGDGTPARSPSQGTESPEGAAASSPSPQRGWAWVIFNGDTVHAEVADTPAARERGLMFRTDLGENEGMLFVFPNSQIRSFWMRNTYIPLDIAYMDPDFVIVDIKQMEPEDETLIDSARPAMFALETRQGWFERRGISVGDRAQVVWGRR